MDALLREVSDPSRECKRSAMSKILKARQIIKWFEEHSDSNQWIVVLGLSTTPIDTVTSDRSGLAEITYRFQWEGFTGLIKVVPTAEHEIVTDEFVEAVRDQTGSWASLAGTRPGLDPKLTDPGGVRVKKHTMPISPALVALDRLETLATQHLLSKSHNAMTARIKGCFTGANIREIFAIAELGLSWTSPSLQSRIVPQVQDSPGQEIRSWEGKRGQPGKKFTAIAQVAIFNAAWESKLVGFESEAQTMWPAQLTSFGLFTTPPPLSKDNTYLRQQIQAAPDISHELTQQQVRDATYLKELIAAKADYEGKLAKATSEFEAEVETALAQQREVAERAAQEAASEGDIVIGPQDFDEITASLL
ncbi:hypothetical protein N7471_004656 [Penicillium samsonianum]|uniref:uncharacterized protein n=1 Tax=Penicillium samsonianum TaxID=1882272 RepID=UPI002547BA41|nr:uncharacterized protein N7471_004656 [Penicillium samsonianum]KAJ6138170.1 hypothetical protein N7471_004656 [Penicillium samsonianum]